MQHRAPLALLALLLVTAANSPTAAAQTYTITANDCPPGFRVNGTVTSGNCTQRVCAACPQNWFAVRENSVECQRCEPPAFTETWASMSCRFCRPNTYFTDTFDYPDCRVCPSVGSMCWGGSIDAMPGFWMTRDPYFGSWHVYRCADSRACLQGPAPGLCAANHADPNTNPLCARCADGFSNSYSSPSRYGGKCVDCGGSVDMMWASVSFLVGVLGVGLLVLLDHRLSYRLPSTLFTLVFMCQTFGVILATDKDSDDDSIFIFFADLFSFQHSLRVPDVCAVATASEGLIMADILTPLFYLGQLAVVAVPLRLLKHDAFAAAKRVAAYLVFLTAVPAVRAAAQVFNITTVQADELLTVAPAISATATLEVVAILVIVIYMVIALALLSRVRAKPEVNEDYQIEDSGEGTIWFLEPFAARLYSVQYAWFSGATLLRLVLISLAAAYDNQMDRFAHLTAILALTLAVQLAVHPFRTKVLEVSSAASIVWALVLVLIMQRSEQPYETFDQAIITTAALLPLVAYTIGFVYELIRRQHSCCSHPSERGNGHLLRM